MPDVNLMWIGNTDLLSSNPNSNASQSQFNAILGWEAEGRSEVKPVALNGEPSYGFGQNAYFRTTYDEVPPSGGWRPNPGEPASQFSYDDPQTGDPLSGVSIRAFATATFDITVHDEDGNSSVVRQSGVVIQMSNGDLFFRPSLQTVDEWDGINQISRVEIVSVAPISNNVSTIGFNAGIFETEIVCFTRGTLIACPDGLRPVQDLRPGDLVLTCDNGAQPIRWIGGRRFDGPVLAALPRLRPIRIRAGALGQGLPESDLLVSPQHRVLVRSNIARKMFGAFEVLVAAKQLLLLEGVDIAHDLDGVEYFHFIFDRHEIVLSNGAETESLYPGAEAVKSVGPAARAELFAIFPQLQDGGFEAEAARPLVSGRQARRLAVRHEQNRKPLLAALEG